ncbi:MAG: tRNA (guanosine(37)-N1)-methyltransferase TrmD, partial [Candidatus Portnoybacteria bacterium RBG_19FT_COMBO_36_7]
MTRFDIISIFPNIFSSYFSESILKRAQKAGLIKIGVHDLRKWTADRHKTVDDSPYGGGPGMVFKIEPIYKAVQFLSSKFKVQSSKLGRKSKKSRIILFSAKGKQFTQADACRLAKYNQLILICGRYEGVDERIAQHIADEEISVGNFVLTGGEIPAMILVDAVSRLIPGVLGKKESLAEESFSKVQSPKSLPKARLAKGGKVQNYLEYPQYTRPEKFKGWKVPEILLSG